MQVVVAEDDPIIRRMLQHTVERLGHGCLLAEDGEQAWELYCTHRPDVVISDWMMPGLDGLSLCRRIREQAPDPNEFRGYTYFVMLTALSEKEHRWQGMRAGADDYLTKPLDADDLQFRLIAAQRLTSLHRRLMEQTRELQRLNEQFYRDGRVDTLTGLGNRRQMQEHLDRAHAYAERYGRPYAVGIVDIDHFKEYNDTLGHLAGDEALRAVARALREGPRSTDAVYRYGGEEFLVFLPEQWAEGARSAVERLREHVRDLNIPHPGRDPTHRLSISAGIAVYDPSERPGVASVLERADEALYAAKHAGRACTRMWRSGEES